jgi:SH3 domain-containing YSC84-like protein 1
MRFLSKITAAAALATVLVAGAAQARPADEQGLLRRATDTASQLRGGGTFGPSADLLRRARGVFIVPTLVKGGFIFGAEGGNGVLLERLGAHNWSSPAFYTIGSASFGLQIGLEKAQMVMFLMSDRALRAVEQDKFKFGAGAGLTVITVGANAQGATSGNLTGDIIVWSSTQGAYGGLTLEGSVIAPDRDTNDDFYGRPTTVRQILSGGVHNPQARELRMALGGR